MEQLTKKQVKDHVEAINQNGYSIIENAIQSDFLKEIIDELDHLESVRPGGDIPPPGLTDSMNWIIWSQLGREVKCHLPA